MDSANPSTFHNGSENYSSWLSLRDPNLVTPATWFSKHTHTSKS